MNNNRRNSNLSSARPHFWKNLGFWNICLPLNYSRACCSYNFTTKINFQLVLTTTLGVFYKIVNQHCSAKNQYNIMFEKLKTIAVDFWFINLMVMIYTDYSPPSHTHNSKLQSDVLKLLLIWFGQKQCQNLCSCALEVLVIKSFSAKL